MISTLNHRNFVGAISFLGVLLATPQMLWAGESLKGMPNIVFILADDMGHGDPGCYNKESKIPTPNMDRLALEGMRFTDAHSGSAVCTPTRYGVITGRYCWRTVLKMGVLSGYSASLIEPKRMTVASLLKRHGYRTACIGKWHLGLDWTKDEEGNVDFSKPIRGGPVDHGFDYFFGISASLDMPPYVYIENDRTVGIPNQTIERARGLARFRGGAIAPGFKHIDVLPTLTKKAVAYVEEHVRSTPDRPFFVYFPLTAPHTPVLPIDRVKGRSKAGDYGDFVVEVDWTVGEVMGVLDRHKLTDNTLIIVTSDNGSTMEPMAEHQHLPNGHLRGRKSDIWEGGHRVPFIARWPAAIKPGTTSDQTVCLTDLLATCAAIVGAKLPEDAGEDSYDLLPALLGRKLHKSIREATVHHSIQGMFAIRRGPWKLVLGRGSGGWSTRGVKFKRSEPLGQLYNMAEDPAERTNLYRKRPEIVRRLTALLAEYNKQGNSRPR